MQGGWNRLDDKYVFDDLGYNLIPSEISAAFASVQLKKLDKNIKNRWDNFQKIKNGISNFDGYQTFDTYEGIYTGWLAFPLLLKGNLIEEGKITNLLGGARSSNQDNFYGQYHETAGRTQI